MIVPPLVNFPASSAAWIIAKATRSLTEPAGLKNSSLTYTSAAFAGTTLFNLTIGVLPIVSKIES